MTTASPYKEERTQGSLAFDVLHGKTQYSVSYTLSDESDYTANTASFDVSQDLFGDLTTVSFGFSQGWDEVRKRDDDVFEESIDRRNYRFGLQQIVTPRLMAGLNYEVITDEGFLNNPYRSVRYLDDSSARGFSYQPVLYPQTRTSIAVSLNARYYLPYRASVHGEYRYWQTAVILRLWQEQVEGLPGWQVHRHEGYRAITVDVTAFWRPALQNCPSKHYHPAANRALPAVIMGMIGEVGEIGGQRLACPLAF